MFDYSYLSAHQNEVMSHIKGFQGSEIRLVRYLNSLSDFSPLQSADELIQKVITSQMRSSMPSGVMRLNPFKAHLKEKLVNH